MAKREAEEQLTDRNWDQPENVAIPVVIRSPAASLTSAQRRTSRSKSGLPQSRPFPPESNCPSHSDTFSLLPLTAPTLHHATQ